MLNNLSWPSCRIHFKKGDPLSWKERVIEAATGYLTLSNRVALIVPLGEDSLILQEGEKLNLRDGWTWLKVVSYATLIFPLIAWVALFIALHNHRELPQEACLSYIDLRWAVERDKDQQKSRSLLEKITPQQLALDGQRVLRMALQNQWSDFSGDVIAKTDLTQLSASNPLALKWAVDCNDVANALLLIQKMGPEQLSFSLLKDSDLTVLMYILGNQEAYYSEIVLALIGKMSPEQISLPQWNGVTPLMAAVARRHTNIALALIQKMTPDQVALHVNGQTALTEAIKLNNLSVAYALIQKMPPHTFSLQESDTNLTALMRASLWDRIEVVHALIQKMTPEQFLIGRITIWDIAGRTRPSEITALIRKCTLKDLQFTLQRANILWPLIKDEIRKEISCRIAAIGCIQPNPDSPLHRSFERSSIREPRTLALVREFL